MEVSQAGSLRRIARGRVTHHSVYNGVLPKQDDLARRARHDSLHFRLRHLPLALTLLQSQGRQPPIQQPLHGAHAPGAGDSHPLQIQPLATRDARGLVNGPDRAGLEQGGFEVVDQVGGVFDADAEADQVFGEVSRGPDGRVDRGVTGSAGQT